METLSCLLDWIGIRKAEIAYSGEEAAAERV
jgi:hypothetical protein